jgi:hypothetical protein
MENGNLNLESCEGAETQRRYLTTDFTDYTDFVFATEEKEGRREKRPELFDRMVYFGSGIEYNQVQYGLNAGGLYASCHQGSERTRRDHPRDGRRFPDREHHAAGADSQPGVYC